MARYRSFVFLEARVLSQVQADSHKKSLSEAFVNSFGGYPVGYGLGIVILPLSMGWIQEDPFVANLAITFVYVYCTEIISPYF